MTKKELDRVAQFFCRRRQNLSACSGCPLMECDGLSRFCLGASKGYTPMGTDWRGLPPAAQAKFAAALGVTVTERSVTEEECDEGILRDEQAARMREARKP